MPQIHDSPPSTADPDPVRIALTDPKVLDRLRYQAKCYLLKNSRSMTWMQVSQDSDDVVNESIKLALERSANFDPTRNPSVSAWVGFFTPSRR